MLPIHTRSQLPTLGATVVVTGQTDISGQTGSSEDGGRRMGLSAYKSELE